MGPEPSPPDDLFDHLILALERRRAAVNLELKSWQQRRNRLREAVLQASEAEQSTCSIAQLASIEAGLGATINEVVSDSGCITRGHWNTADVEEKVERLFQALAVCWENVQVGDHIFRYKPIRGNEDNANVPLEPASKLAGLTEITTPLCSEKEDAVVGFQDICVSRNSAESDLLLNNPCEHAPKKMGRHCDNPPISSDLNLLNNISRGSSNYFSGLACAHRRFASFELLDEKTMEKSLAEFTDISCDSAAPKSFENTSDLSGDTGSLLIENLRPSADMQKASPRLSQTEESDPGFSQSAAAQTWRCSRQYSVQDSDSRTEKKGDQTSDVESFGYQSDTQGFISKQEFRCRNPVSVTYLKKKFYVVEIQSPTSQKIFVYTKSGSALGAFVLKQSDDRQVVCSPSFVRSCQVKQWVIIVDQSHDRIICARPNGVVDAIIDTQSGLQDAISTGIHLIACFPLSGIFISSIDNPKQLSKVEITCAPNPNFSVRLAWCDINKTLLITDVDEANTDMYRIRAFKLFGQCLHLQDRPSLTVNSTVIPSVLIQDDQLVVGRMCGTTAIFSWLSSFSTSLSDQYDSLDIECFQRLPTPMDITWMSSETGSLAACKSTGSIVVLTNRSPNHHNVASASVTVADCNDLEDPSLDTDAKQNLDDSSLAKANPATSTNECRTQIVCLGNDSLVEIVSDSLIEETHATSGNNANSLSAISSFHNASSVDFVCLSEYSVIQMVTESLVETPSIGDSDIGASTVVESVKHNIFQSDSVYQLFQTNKPKSAAVFSNHVYVANLPDQGCLSKYSLSGEYLSSICLDKPDNETKPTYTYRIRVCTKKQWIMLTNHCRKVVLCVNSEGRLLQSIKMPKGGFEDIVCTNRQLVVCTPGKIFTTMLDDLEDVKQCSTSSKFIYPVRMAWSSETETLLIVDRISADSTEYQICAFNISGLQLVPLLAPCLTIKSSIIPNVLLNSEVMILVLVSGSDCIISWLPSNATSFAAELCRILVHDIIPRDMCWLPPELSGYGEAIICNASGSVLAVRRPPV